MFDFFKTFTFSKWKSWGGFVLATLVSLSIINTVKTAVGFISTIEQGFNLGKFLPKF